MSARYRIVLFDLDNTLFDYDRADSFALENTFISLGRGCETARRRYCDEINHTLQKEYELGQIRKEELRATRFRRFLSTIGVEADSGTFSETYLQYLSQGIFLVRGAVAMLTRLNHAGYGLVGISNGIAAVQKARLSASPIMDCLDTVVFSEDAGEEKPHAGFFDHTLRFLGLEKRNDVLVVGDSLASDIDGSLKYGLDACWFNPDNTAGSPEIKPTFTINELMQLPDLLQHVEMIRQ